MSKLVQIAVLFIFFLPLSACKTWYKPGADGEMLTEDQQRCEDETQASTGKLYIECMRSAGWYHSNTSATDSRSERAASPVVEDEAAQPTVQHDNVLPVEVLSTGVTPPVTADAAEPRRVQGWVQFGEDTEQLEDARTQCEGADAAGDTVNECMQGEGWRPITFRITVEEPDELE